MSGGPAEDAIVAALQRFTGFVNAGDMPAALACFTANPSIVEDIAPYHWQGPGAGAAWLAAMGANAARAGMTGITMTFHAPTLVLTEGDRGYAVLPGDLAYAFGDGSVRRVRGHGTFAVQRDAADWKIETLTWGWERELA